MSSSTPVVIAAHTAYPIIMYSHEFISIVATMARSQNTVASWECARESAHNRR